MHPAPHLTRLPAATHTQVRDHARTPITLPQHQSMPLPTTAPPHPHMKILRAPARSAPRRATPPPAAPRPPARPARRSGGRMDARGGRAGGWRLGAGGRGGEGGCTRGVGGRAERQPPRREPRGCERTSPAAAAAALISRRGCRATGKLGRKGQAAAARTRKPAARARVRHRCPRTENAVTTSPPAALAASARHGFRRAARGGGGTCQRRVVAAKRRTSRRAVSQSTGCTSRLARRWVRRMPLP